MKKTIVLFAATLFTLASFAQRPHHPGFQKGGRPGMENRKGNMQKHMQELNLSDAQKTQMKESNSAFREKMKTLMQNENITVKAQRDQRAKLAKDHQAQIQKIFTPEQKATIQKLKGEREQKMQEMQAKGFEKMSSKLNLTETQQKQLTENRNKNREAMKALQQNESLDRTAKQSQMKKLAEQQKKQMEQILSKEQMSQLKEMKKGGHGRRPMKKGHGMKKPAAV